MACTSRLERQARLRGFRLVAGLDEAGRGCLFGPVYAGAVILDPARPIRGLNDSKQLNESRRDVLAGRIRERALAWAVAKVDAGLIDRINILQASRLAMKLAVEQLRPVPDFLLVDAVAVDVDIAQRAVIHGDALSHSIAAASILAKVDRDRSMAEWEQRYPGYGFLRHRGYATAEHREALERLGPTPFHRYSYEPVRQAAGLAPKQLALFDS
ncbi:MAG: ribonuclease HII [Bryobacteraceae bacterium]